MNARERRATKHEFPTAGFYQFKYDDEPPSYYYVSGTTTGNAYFDPEGHGEQWHKLVWTAVPTQEHLAAHYTYLGIENPTKWPLTP